MIKSPYIATSLIPVMASSMLKISAPTTIPITKITSGSKSEVKRRMAGARFVFVDVRHAGEHLIQFAGFFADRQQVRGEGRENGRLAQRVRRCLRRASRLARLRPAHSRDTRY